MFDTFKGTLILFTKSSKVITRNTKYVLFFLLSPILAVLLINFYEKEIKRVEDSMVIKDFPISTLGKIPKCSYPSDCINLGYYIIVPYT